MKRRALMVTVFVVALGALVLWNPMERTRLGVADEERTDAAAGRGAAPAAKNAPLPADAPRSGEGHAAREWWDTPRASDDDASIPPPMRKVRTPSGDVRFVSAVLSMEITDIDPSLHPEAALWATEEADAAGEPSDLDDDHPGSYWANLGYTSIRAVLSDLGVNADAAWVDGASGQMTVSQRMNSEQANKGERLIVLAPEATPGDADGDGRASGLDVARFLKSYGSKGIDADANDDGVVDQRDLVRFLRDWSEGAG